MSMYEGMDPVSVRRVDRLIGAMVEDAHHGASSLDREGAALFHEAQLRAERITSQVDRIPVTTELQPRVLHLGATATNGHNA